MNGGLYVFDPDPLTLCGSAAWFLKVKDCSPCPLEFDAYAGFLAAHPVPLSLMHMLDSLLLTLSP